MPFTFLLVSLVVCISATSTKENEAGGQGQQDKASKTPNSASPGGSDSKLDKATASKAVMLSSTSSLGLTALTTIITNIVLHSM
ncbi:expressed protein [Echinococcus multilocularis]|uniref:Expressed protein n=1 Tax=Echinococcus multilocularis TaxID=6211 RepID=A0A068Y520_ECHMU|nr:expressed protein [Echinococcus multilocularis]